MSFEEEVAIKHAKAVAEMGKPSKKELSKQEIYENFITNKNNKNNEKLKTFAEQLDKNYFMLKILWKGLRNMSFMTRSPPLLMVLYKAPSY